MSNTTKVLAIISLPIAVGLFFLSPAVYLVKPGLVSAVIVLRILALSLPLFYITAPLMWSLIAKKKDHLVLAVYLVAALVNALLNLSFVQSYGAPAAAINTGITELFIFLALLYVSKKIPLT